MDLSLQWDRSQVDFFKAHKLERVLFKVLRMSGRDASRAMKAAGNRSVRQRKRIKVARINSAFGLKALSASKIEDLTWVMTVKGNPIPLSEYPYSQNKRGVSVAVNRSSGRKLIRSAFEAKMRSGHVGVFTRAGAGSPRLPIKQLFSSKITDVFKDSGMIPAVFARTQRVFAETFERVLPLELAKVKR